MTKQKQDKPEKKVHYEFPPNFAGMVDGDNEAPYLVNKAPSDQYHTKNPEGGNLEGAITIEKLISTKELLDILTSDNRDEGERRLIEVCNREPGKSQTE